jgi:translation initiation factor IF-3
VTFKEVRLSPKIGVGDFDTKVNRAIEFLEDGDRIKVTVRFRGRELTHPELGRNLIARFADRVKDHGTPERTPLLEGKSMHITMASTHKPKGHEGPAPKGADGGAAREGGAAPAASARPAPTSAVASANEAAASDVAAQRPAAPAKPAAAKPAGGPVTEATAGETKVATARSEPKSTNDKTPAPEPVRTGE